MTTPSELRNKIHGMTKLEMVNLRDELENNWDNSLRPLMQILSLGCITRFKITLSKI